MPKKPRIISDEQRVLPLLLFLGQFSAANRKAHGVYTLHILLVEQLQNSGPYARPVHSNQPNAFVERDIKQQQILLFNDMEMSDSVFCS